MYKTNFDMYSYLVSYACTVGEDSQRLSSSEDARSVSPITNSTSVAHAGIFLMKSSGFDSYVTDARL